MTPINSEDTRFQNNNIYFWWNMLKYNLIQKLKLFLANQMSITFSGGSQHRNNISAIAPPYNPTQWRHKLLPFQNSDERIMFKK